MQDPMIAIPLSKTSSVSESMTLGSRDAEEAAVELDKAASAKYEPVLQDKNNPQLWSKSKKYRNNSILALATFALTYASSVLSPALSHIQEYYGVARVPALLAIALFVLGFGLGPFLCGPTSEVLGRRPVYVYSYAVFTAFSWAAAYAPNLPALVVFRFLSGLSGASTISNHPASIADYTSPQLRNRYMASYAFAAFAGAAIAPCIGGFITHYASWHWNFIVTAILVTVSWLLIVVGLDESYAPVLLAKQNYGGRRKDGPSLATRFKIATVVPFKLLFTEPVLALCSAYLSVLYGIMYCFFPVFPIIYVEIRGWSQDGLALSYIALTLGFVAGAIILRYGQDYAYNKVAQSLPEGQRPPPDARLAMMFYFSWTVPVGIFLIAFCSYRQTHWFGDVLGMFMFSMGTLIVFTGLIPFVVETYLPVAASANAATVAARSCTAAAFPLFSTQMYHKLGVPGASCLLAGIAVLLTPMPWVFRHYRERLRGDVSKYVK